MIVLPKFYQEARRQWSKESQRTHFEMAEADHFQDGTGKSRFSKETLPPVYHETTSFGFQYTSSDITNTARESSMREDCHNASESVGGREKTVLGCHQDHAKECNLVISIILIAFMKPAFLGVFIVIAWNIPSGSLQIRRPTLRLSIAFSDWCLVLQTKPRCDHTSKTFFAEEQEGRRRCLASHLYHRRRRNALSKKR